jgi:DNA-binding beta-propeller fold protein YncE
VSMVRTICVAVCGLLLVVSVAASAMADDAPPPVSFSKDVAPMLLKKCQACHGSPEPKGGYQVSNYTLVIKAGESESASITPGKPEESELLALISSADPDSRMPKEGDPLSAEQIALVKRWISEGAKYDGADPKASLASIVPKMAAPDPPQAYRRGVPITALAFSPDGQELAANGYHEVTIWNAASGAPQRRIKNVAERTYSLAYNPDGSLLAAACGTPGQAGEVKLFNPATGELVKDLGSMGDVAYRAAFNPAGTKLAVGGADRSIRIYDVAGGKQEILIEDHADWVVGLAWSPDGTRLASASRDKTSKLLNAANGESLMTYSGQGDQVFGVGFSADGKIIYTAGADKKVHAWNPEDGQKKGEFAGFGREVFGLMTYQDKIFTCSGDKTVQQHRAEGLKPFKAYPGHTDAVYAVAYHPGTGRVAAGSFSGEVRIWNAEDAAPVATFIAAPGYTAPPSPVAAAK